MKPSPIRLLGGIASNEPDPKYEGIYINNNKRRVNAAYYKSSIHKYLYPKELSFEGHILFVPL